MRRFLSLVIVAGLAFSAGCGGGGGTPAGVPTGGGGGGTPTGSGNTLPIAVDGGPVSGIIYPDGAFTSVTLCNPGTATCQTIDGILVDTGSFGLRILSSAITLTGLQAVTSGSSTLYNCINFVDGSFLWGTAAVADVEMAGERATSETIQVIADPPQGQSAIPTECQNNGTDEDFLTGPNGTGLGAQGILGIGPEPVDCGEACDPSFNGNVPPVPSPYYLCTSSFACSATSVSISQQVQNPVALFPVDNNGTIVELPTLSGAAASQTGSLIFGIGTETNNQVPATASIFALDSEDTFSVTYKGVTYNSTFSTPSFIDLGSNGLFFPDATITVCTDVTDFYCPASLLSLSAVNSETVAVTGDTSSVDFSIDNADNLFAEGNGADAAFSTLGGPNTGGGFDYGLPFFYGRNVFTSIDGGVVPSGTPPAPWWAY
ncbi:MAG: DUF3443 family protein [Terriglobales bacterium]